jgi:hypothetical protein
VSARCIHAVQLLGHLLGLVDAATHNAGSLLIKVAQVGEGVCVPRIQPCGLFKLFTAWSAFSP